MMKNTKHFGRRSLSLFLVLVLCLSMLNLTVFAAEESSKLICDQEEHEHTEECYQVERGELTCKTAEGEGAVEARPCTHSHDESCGYVAAVEGVACSHEHDGTCGYAEGTAEVPCSCTPTLIDGVSEHQESCGYQPATEGSPCTHNHEDCGYVAAVEGVACSHEHNNACGYAEAVQGHQHTDACYQTVRTLTCDKNEHTHSEACYEKEQEMPEEVSKFLCIVAELPAVDAITTENVEAVRAQVGNGWDAYYDVLQICHEWSENTQVRAGLATLYAVEKQATMLWREIVLQGTAFAAAYEGGTLTISGEGELTDDVVWALTVTADGVEQTVVECLKEKAQTLVIGDGITSIGHKAFYLLDMPANITFSGSVDAIGDEAFVECGGLKSVTLENMSTVGARAFKECPDLTSVTLIDVDTVSQEAFYLCSALNQLTISNVGSIGQNGFRLCSALKEVELTNVGTVGSYAFYQCEGLEKATITEADTIGQSAFQECPALKEVELTNVGTVNQNGFRQCPALKEVELTNVGAVNQNGFRQCSALTGVTLNAVGSIGLYAFKDCTSLCDVTGLETVSEKIDGFAFHNCPNLTNLTVADGTRMGFIGSSDSIMARVEAILKGQFKLDDVPEIAELAPDAGWTDSKTSKSENWNQYDNGTQAVEQARWIDEDAAVAEVKVDAYYTAEQQMDYIFVADLSSSMAQVGNTADRNARFYDMQSKLLDVTGQLLNSVGYDSRVAIVTFGGQVANNPGTAETMDFTNDASATEAYIKAMAPYFENTDYGLGLKEALKLIEAHQETARKVTVVFLSDGIPSNSGTSGDLRGTQTAAAIKEAGVEIYGVLHSPNGVAQARAAMEAVCDEVFVSHNTESFGKAMNNAFSAVYSGYTLTIPVGKDFDFADGSIQVSASAGEAEYDAAANSIVWTIQGMPFTKHTLTFRETLKDELVDVVGTKSYDTNNGDAVLRQDGKNMLQVETPVLSRTVTPPTVPTEPDPVTPTYRLRIEYVYEDGTQAGRTVNRWLESGERYNVASPVIEGYTPDQTAVSGTMPARSLSVTVTYKADEPTEYTLTVKYVYEDGTQAAEDYTATLPEGGSYGVDSPVIEGFTADQATVSGTMPEDDVAVTVTYKADEPEQPDEDLEEDPEVPLGETPEEPEDGEEPGEDLEEDPEVPLGETPEEPGDGEEPDEDLGEDPDVPLGETPDEDLGDQPDVPLGETPEEDLGDEPEVPLDETPATGDASRTALWAALCGVSLAGLTVLGKKKEDEEA